MVLGSLGKLFVELGADTSGLDKGLDGADSKVSGFGDKLKASGMAIGAGMTVAGAGIMALTDSSMKTNAALSVTALQLGITTEEMRDLALETANVTFPLEEVTASFDLLTRAGMLNEEQIANTATSFDTLGDAIGLPASEVTNSLIPAFNAFGIPLENAEEHTDTFTHLLRNTTIELSDFSSMVEKIAPELELMDMSMEESAAILEVLSDKGIQGTAATREFRTAVSAAASAPEKLSKANENLTKAEEKLIEVQDKQTLAIKKAQAAVVAAAESPDKLAKAEQRLIEVQNKASIAISKAEKAVSDKKSVVDGATTSQEAFYESLGITAIEVAAYTDEINGATGMTDDFAAAANTQFSTMDKIKHAISEATLQYGSMLEPIEALGPAMMTIGPAMMGISSVGPATTTAFRAMAGGVKALNLAFLANPIVIAIAAIIAILAIIYLAWTNDWGGIQEKTKKIFEFMSEAFEQVKEILTAFITNAINYIGQLGDKLLFLLGPVGALIYAFRHWDEITAVVRRVLGGVINFINGLVSSFRNAGSALMTALMNGITSKIDAVVATVKRALKKVEKYLPFSDAKEGPLSHITESGKALMTTFAKGIESASPAPQAAFAAQAPNVLDQAAGAGGGGSISNTSSINIGEVHLSNDYNFEALMKDIDIYQHAQRIQRGIGTI